MAWGRDEGWKPALTKTQGFAEVGGAIPQAKRSEAKCAFAVSVWTSLPPWSMHLAHKQTEFVCILLFVTR